MPTALFYIGSYSIPSPWAGAPLARGAGICRAEFEIESGEIILGPREPQINPSFLVRNDEAGRLWTVTEPETGGGGLFLPAGNSSPAARARRKSPPCPRPRPLPPPPAPRR